MSLESLVNWENYLIYRNFLNQCKLKTYSDDLVLHRHHIIPRHYGGTNKKDNLITLSVDDHAKAHLLFADCFEENSYERRANLQSARLLSNKSIKDKELMEKIKEGYIGENNPFFGKKHTEEVKNKLAEYASKRWKDKTYEELYGEKAVLEKEKRKEGVKKYFENASEEELKIRSRNISDSLKGKDPWNKGKSFKYVINGITYERLKYALEAFNCSTYKELKKITNVEKIQKS